MKIRTIINPEFKGLKEVPSQCGTAYVNVNVKQEKLKKQEQLKAHENCDIIDILYEIPDIENDWK